MPATSCVHAHHLRLVRYRLTSRRHSYIYCHIITFLAMTLYIFRAGPNEGWSPRDFISFIIMRPMIGPHDITLYCLDARKP